MDPEKQELDRGQRTGGEGQNRASPARSEMGESPSEETLQQTDNEMPVDAEKDGHLKRTKSIAEAMSLPHEIAFVATICMAQVLTQVGLNQCIAILHVIGDSFGITDPGELSWLIAGYSLTVGTFIMISGRFGDLFGHKLMLLIGFAWLSLWSVILGLSVYSNHVLFTFARVFQGIGPAIALPNALAILGVTYADGPRKHMVFAIFGATAPVGAVLGGVFAGVFALAWWPWAFFSLSIATAITALVGCFVIPDPPKEQPQHHYTSLRQKIIDLDLLGATVGIAALVLFNFAWNQAPIVGWQKAYVYVLMMIGILLVPVFFYIELRVSPSPLIHFEALSPDVGFVLACVACGWSCFGICVFYIWQFFEELRGASPLLGAAYLSPIAVSGAAAAVCTGFLLSRLRPAWLMTIALAMFTVGTILIATAPVRQTYWTQTFICAIVMPWGMINSNPLLIPANTYGLGMDMSFPAATLILSNAVSKEHQGVAASLVNTVVNYSISLGLGFAGTVQVHVNNGGKTPEDLLKGYRGAFYMGRSWKYSKLKGNVAKNAIQELDWPDSDYSSASPSWLKATGGIGMDSIKLPNDIW